MQKTSGILLHPTSLPGDYPVGGFDHRAQEFVDFLVKAGQSVWQILPLGPTGYGHSPYNALSAFAGNPVLIDLKQLVNWGDLDEKNIDSANQDKLKLSFAATHDFKHSLLQLAGKTFLHEGSVARKTEYAYFCQAHSDWLDDFSLFTAIKDHFNGRSWNSWPEDIRLRYPAAITSYCNQLNEACDLVKYQQYVFFKQWLSLKEYANKLGIRIFGDIPIFVAYDSADVWANQHLFQLDDKGHASAIAGVPPDYFSKTGQRWGNPLYRWEEHIRENFDWWLRRFRHQFDLCDLVRIDHFRGFQACWSIPASEDTAVNGRWESVPGRKLLTMLQNEYPDMPIVAEDLGVITPEVERLRDDFRLPGMKILQFAFDSGPGNPYLPENFGSHSVVYTGTHDNNTTLGWWQNLTKVQQEPVRNYFGKKRLEMPRDLVRLAMSSRAEMCIIPCQDILALDNIARLNTPGQAAGNWEWQASEDKLNDDVASRLYHDTREYKRLPVQ